MAAEHVRAELVHVPRQRPDEVLRGDVIDWAGLDPDGDEDYEWDHRGPLRDMINALLSDMRDAAGQLDQLDGDAREVGRWLRGRVGHAVVNSRHLR